MRPVHLAAVAALLVAVILGIWLVLGSGLAVFAADPRAVSSAAAGIGPAGALENVDPAAVAATVSGRSAIPFDEPPPAAPEFVAPVRPRLSGRIVDPKGAGVPFARVWISTSEFWARLPLDLETEAMPARWLRVVRTDADAEGRYVLEDQKPGKLRLAARGTGFAPAYRDDLDLPRRAVVELPDVALGPGVVVAGVVLGPDNKPAAGVRILIAADCLVRGSHIDVPGRGAPIGVSDAEGKFRVDELAPGPWHLLFLAEGMALAELSDRTERAGELQDGFVVRLELGVEVSGRVRAAEGALPGDLRVQARRSTQPDPDAMSDGNEAGEPPDSARAEARPRVALVGPDGAFQLAGLRSGEKYRLTLAQKRGETWRPLGSAPAVESRAPAGGLEIVYKPDAALVLRVVDDATGAPIESLVAWAGLGRFRALYDDKNEVQRAFPGGLVRYAELRVPATNAKPTWLKVAAEGYQDYERKDLRLAAGQELDVGEVRLKAERKLVVSVVDDVGQPVAGARVVLGDKLEQLENWTSTPPEFDLWGEINARYARTGSDGRCTLSSWPGKSVWAQASARGFVSSLPQPLTAPKDLDHILQLQLRRGAIVVVRVGDGGGRAVPGVPVGHRYPRRATDEDEERREEPRSTDAKGEVRYEACEPGVHAFRVEQEDGESAWWQDDEGAEARENPWLEATLAVAGEMTIDLVAPQRGTLSGVVREGGRPLEGAVVKLVPYVEGRDAGWTWSGNGQDPFSCPTDHQGAYRIENRRVGEYVVLVHHTERRMASEYRHVLGVGDQTLDFSLDSNGIEGRVVDPEGMPLVGVAIGISRAQAGIEMEPPHQVVLTEDDRGNPNLQWRQRGNQQAKTDSSGLYVLRGLVENTGLVVSCQGDEVENKSTDPITLAPGEMRRGVDFVLRRAGRIQVELVGQLPDDRWFEVHVVQRTGESESTVRQAWLATWNRSEMLGSIVPGRYFVRLVSRQEQGGESRLLEIPVEVELGRVVRVPLQVP